MTDWGLKSKPIKLFLSQVAFGHCVYQSNREHNYKYISSITSIPSQLGAFCARYNELLFILDSSTKTERQLNHWESHPIQSDDSWNLQPWSSLHNFHGAWLVGESPSPGTWYLVNLENFRNFLEIWDILLSDLYELDLGSENQGTSYRKEMFQIGKSYTTLLLLKLWAMSHIP